MRAVSTNFFGPLSGQAWALVLKDGLPPSKGSVSAWQSSCLLLSLVEIIQVFPFCYLHTATPVMIFFPMAI